MSKFLSIFGLALFLGVCFSPQIFRAKQTVVAEEDYTLTDPSATQPIREVPRQQDTSPPTRLDPEHSYESGFDPVYEARAKATLLVVSLSRRQLSFYSYGELVKSYPIAIGQRGWETPPGEFQVMQMLENPDWIHPLTNEHVPSGNPKNPLGYHWIGFWTDGHNWIGFHGTPERGSVGQAMSHGCIRMYNEDIEELFYSIVPGTTVIVQR